MTYLFRRPDPKGASDIGYWHLLLQIVSMIAVASNLAVIFFKTDVMQRYINWYQSSSGRASGETKMWMFLFIEHILLLVIVLITNHIPAVPVSVRKHVERQSYLTEQLIVKEDEDDFDVAFDQPREGSEGSEYNEAYEGEYRISDREYRYIYGDDGEAGEEEDGEEEEDATDATTDSSYYFDSGSSSSSDSFPDHHSTRSSRRESGEAKNPARTKEGRHSDADALAIGSNGGGKERASERVGQGLGTEESFGADSPPLTSSPSSSVTQAHALLSSIKRSAKKPPRTSSTSALTSRSKASSSSSSSSLPSSPPSFPSIVPPQSASRSGREGLSRTSVASTTSVAVPRAPTYKHADTHAPEHGGVLTHINTSSRESKREEKKKKKKGKREKWETHRSARRMGALALPGVQQTGTVVLGKHVLSSHLSSSLDGLKLQRAARLGQAQILPQISENHAVQQTQQRTHVYAHTSRGQDLSTSGTTSYRGGDMDNGGIRACGAEQEGARVSADQNRRNDTRTRTTHRDATATPPLPLPLPSPLPSSSSLSSSSSAHSSSDSDSAPETEQARSGSLDRFSLMVRRRVNRGKRASPLYTEKPERGERERGGGQPGRGFADVSVAVMRRTTRGARMLARQRRHHRHMKKREMIMKKKKKRMEREKEDERERRMLMENLKSGGRMTFERIVTSRDHSF